MGALNPWNLPAARRRLFAELLGAVRVVAWEMSLGGAPRWRARLDIPEGARMVGAELDGVAHEGEFNTSAGFIYLYDLEVDPNDAQVVVLLAIRVANLAGEAEGAPYEARLSTIPKTRQAVPEFFGGLEVLGGGQLTLENADGLLSRAAGVAWRSARLFLKVEGLA